MRRLQHGGDGGTVRRRDSKIEIRLGHDHWLMSDQEARELADRIHDQIEKGTT